MDFLPCEAEEFKLTFSLSRKCLKSQGLESLRSLRSQQNHIVNQHTLPFCKACCLLVTPFHGGRPWVLMSSLNAQAHGFGARGPWYESPVLIPCSITYQQGSITAVRGGASILLLMLLYLFFCLSLLFKPSAAGLGSGKGCLDVHSPPCVVLNPVRSSLSTGST